MKCNICGNTINNKKYIVKEMMFGMKDKFYYLKCSKCRCLQLMDKDLDFSKYYPKEYYSFHSSYTKEDKVESFLNMILLKINSYIDLDILNAMLPIELLKLFTSLRGIKWNKNTKILDVGCGSGEWLKKISQIGLKNLTGIDLYINKTITYKWGSILKEEIFDIKNKKFDIITFHHSFEHMNNPQNILNKVSELLNDKGVCVIRIPVIDCYAWKKYKINWVQIDAPRHIYLHSTKSIKLLAEKANLNIYNIKYDSTDFQFWGSEGYLKNITLEDGRKRAYGLFGDKKIKEFKRKAKILNKKGLGDQAIFYISKA